MQVLMEYYTPAIRAKDVAKGSLPGLFPAINGVDNPAQMKSLVRKYNSGKGPFFIAEWYPAWFDWWGTKHHTVPAENYSGKLDTVLSAGVSHQHVYVSRRYNPWFHEWRQFL